MIRVFLMALALACSACAQGADSMPTRRYVCEITWSGGGSPTTTMRFRLAATTEDEAIEETDAMRDSILEPNPPAHSRIHVVLMRPATEDEWQAAIDHGQNLHGH